jgi:hypothetical protein
MYVEIPCTKTMCTEVQYIDIQGDQKVSVHLMITMQKVTSNFESVKLTAWQSIVRARGDTRLTLTPSVIHNFNYVIMVSD